MLNRGAIGKAVENILRAGMEGYTIVRNEPRNEDPNMAADTGWIGIYRGRVKYRKHTTGPNPWIAEVEIDVEIQAASMADGIDVEEKLEKAEAQALALITASQNLEGTVQTIKEISVEDDLNVNNTYYQAAIITIRAEVRA